MGEGRTEAASMEESLVPDFDPLLDSEIYDNSAYPISIPSQPPDIRNWFSSYESQQPADSTEGAHFLSSRGLNGSETQDPFEDSRKRKLQEPCSSPEKEQHVLGEDMLARDDALNSSKDVCRKEGASTDSVAAKKKRSLRHILGDEFLTSCQNSMKDQSIVPEKEKICPKGDKNDEPKSHKIRTKTCKEEPEDKCQELISPKQKQEDCVHHTEAKPDENISEAGFISPKIRPSLHGNSEKESRNRGNSDEGRDRGGFRRPMVDKTNHTDKCKDDGFRGSLVNRTDISVDVVPTEDMPSGKWQCPRKRKPYVGPHMKQLGLERWIRRLS